MKHPPFFFFLLVSAGLALEVLAAVITYRHAERHRELIRGATRDFTHALALTSYVGAAMAAAVSLLSGVVDLERPGTAFLLLALPGAAAGQLLFGFFPGTLLSDRGSNTLLRIHRNWGLSGTIATAGIIYLDVTYLNAGC